MSQPDPEVEPEQSLDPLDLLAEWYQWWWDTDSAPAKMPRALHVRSAIALLMAERLNADDHQVKFASDSV